MTNELELYHRIGKFMKKTFPDADAQDHLIKLAHEQEEAFYHPTDIMEYADILICLCGAASKVGFSWANLIEATEKKMTINEARTWVRQPDGTYQHKPL